MGGLSTVSIMHKSSEETIAMMANQGRFDKTPVVGVRERATGKVKAKVTETS